MKETLVTLLKYFILPLLVVGLILLAILYKEAPYKQTILNKHASVVFNTTDKSYLDSVVYVGLDHLNITDVIMVIRPMSESKAKVDNDMMLKAHIVGDDRSYVMYVGDLNRSEAITVISHELIHLHQYYTNKLQVVNGLVIWQQEPVDINEVSYKDRPWEVEAFQKQRELIDNVRLALY